MQALLAINSNSKTGSYRQRTIINRRANLVVPTNGQFNPIISWKVPIKRSRLSYACIDGQITETMINSMNERITSKCKADFVKISDVQGDGRHVEIEVVSNLFRGLSMVKRQQMVYKAIWLELHNTVHAVDKMITLTPDEAHSRA